MVHEELGAVHAAIDRCTLCKTSVRGFAKPGHLERGEGGKIMIIGRGPGNSELRGATAFAGQSGKRLDSWLAAATGNRKDPRRGMYFTSIIKCCHSISRDFPLMSRNCAPFLQRQIEILEPLLVITLGREAYEHVRFADVDYDVALCQRFHSSDYLLISQFRFAFWLLPWPHPSGRNRWHNATANRQRLADSLGFVREVMEGRFERN